MLSLPRRAHNLVFGFEQRPWEFRLANDAPQGSTSNRIVKGHRNGYRRALPTLLHDSVAALLPACGKSVPFKDPTNLGARKDPELPNRHLDLSDKNLVMEAAGNLGRAGCFEKQR